MRLPLAAAVALFGVSVVTLAATVLHLGRADLYVGGANAAPASVRPSPTGSPQASQFAVYTPPSPGASPTASASASASAPAPAAPAPAPPPGDHKHH